jgi:hypothetical protein
VAQNTIYDEGVKDGYVAFVNAGLKVGKYKASDIVNIDETNVDFDFFWERSWVDVEREQLGAQQQDVLQGVLSSLGLQWMWRSYLHTLFTRVQAHLGLKSRKS